VFGNTDSPGDPDLVEAIDLTIGGIGVHVSHGHELGSPVPARLAEVYAADVIVYGHTHQQLVTRVGEKLIVNPGAAGPRRFSLKPSVARLKIEGRKAEIEIIDIA
jgi:putative phosphoesterase